MGAPPRIKLDYGSVADRKKLLGSLSAVTEATGFLWTASDEGRTLECLKPDGANLYCLKKSYRLDDIFSGLPAKLDDDPNPPETSIENPPESEKLPEADIESLSVTDNTWLWICGSHCDVRPKLQGDVPPNAQIRSGSSRCLLGRVKLKDRGGDIEQTGDHLPFEGPGSLRNLMMRNCHVKPFLGIPSKENGLDIEGITVTESGGVFLGLRGPVVGGRAVILEAKAGGIFTPNVNFATHFVDLEGLGVRDLTHDDDDILILAGPVGGLNGPFRIYHWQPGSTGCVQSPKCLYQWPIKVRGDKAKSSDRDVVKQSEHPEAFCWFERDETRGLIVLYDNPDQHNRIKKHSHYSADWIPHPKP
jgi:hypothetical protein